MLNRFSKNYIVSATLFFPPFFFLSGSTLPDSFSSHFRTLRQGLDYQVILTRKAPEFVGSQNKECVQTVYQVSEGGQ